MSRILKNIINSVLGSDSQDYILFHNNNSKDIEILKQIESRPLCFEKNQFDTNSFIKIITDQQLSQDLSILPKFVVSTTLIKYQNAKNLSSLLRIPLFNIIYDMLNLKKEGLFSAAAELDKDINLVFSEDIAQKLYLTNYKTIYQLDEIQNSINEGYKLWKPE